MNQLLEFRSLCDQNIKIITQTVAFAYLKKICLTSMFERYKVTAIIIHRIIISSN